MFWFMMLLMATWIPVGMVSVIVLDRRYQLGRQGKSSSLRAVIDNFWMRPANENVFILGITLGWITFVFAVICVALSIAKAYFKIYFKLMRDYYLNMERHS